MTHPTKVTAYGLRQVLLFNPFNMDFLHRFKTQFLALKHVFMNKSGSTCSFCCFSLIFAHQNWDHFVLSVPRQYYTVGQICPNSTVQYCRSTIVQSSVKQCNRSICVTRSAT